MCTVLKRLCRHLAHMLFDCHKKKKNEPVILDNSVDFPNVTMLVLPSHLQMQNLNPGIFIPNLVLFPSTLHCLCFCFCLYHFPKEKDTH